ncbi:hypothetical protein [Clostridium sp. chh4-2]|uniref:hypothetical protein n=1 Tax=Clostridium sp. chh4-2 TaxID=2067550 RepID=UPI0026D2F8E4
MAGYKACICEGGAERAILDLLLDQDKLIFSRAELLEEEVLRSRKGKDFEEKYLRKEFSGKIIVYRILDSRRENFKISKAYQDKVEIINVVTAPEIEMLIICNEGKYKDFEKRKNMLPSEYCKSVLKFKNVKSVTFVKKYFSDVSVLENSLNEYKRVSKIRKGEQTIWGLLKSNNLTDNSE